MAGQHRLRALPGLIGTLLLVVAATTLAVSSTASLFYEGWGQPGVVMLSYLVPAVSLLVLGVIALGRPFGGGVLLLSASVAAGAWWMARQVQRQVTSTDVLLVSALVMIGPILLAAVLFLFEARHRRLLRQEGVAPSPRWTVRHWRELLLVAGPVAAVAVISVEQLPALLARYDDGLRGARTIAGNGVSLVWAPRGPGWNARDAGGGYPSWDALARHGPAAAERCAHLNEEGTALVAEPARIWRMPTVDEIMRSLTRGGINAGCVWDGRSAHADCRAAPDKETPLWAPEDAPIYYWSAQPVDSTLAFAVNYTGGISVLPRAHEGLGVGFRCVKAVREQKGGLFGRVDE